MPERNRNILIVSDIDGVVRNLYEPIYIKYISTYNYISLNDFIKNIILKYSKKNQNIIMDILNKTSLEIYSTASPDTDIIKLYNKLVDSNQADLLFCTTYINDNIKEKTLEWLDKYIPGHIDAIFQYKGLIYKEIPTKYINKYDGFVIVEDNPTVGKIMAKNTAGKPSVFVEYNILDQKSNKNEALGRIFGAFNKLKNGGEND